MLFEQLTETDKRAISQYIHSYAPDEEGDLNYNPSADDLYNNLPKILHYWDEAKESLFKLLNNNFILHKIVEVEVPETESEDVVYRFKDEHPKFQQYLEKYNNELYLAIKKGIIRATISNYDSWDTGYMFRALTSPKSIFTNALENEIKFIYNGKVYILNKGMKITRALNKMRELLNFASEAEHSEFCILHSQLLNTKKLRGELCLSIHPLDYMSMSDNNNNWCSCMSWCENGCYSSGTIEMMNSKYVIVAYLSSTSEEISFDDYRWNSKKWRELFIVNDDMLFGIKGYPYTDRKLEAIVLEWLRELAHDNLNINYATSLCTSESHYYYPTKYNVDCKIKKVYLQFSTDAMYNDCGAVDHQFFLTSYDCFDKYSDYDTFTYNFNYSGIHNCMFCGEEFMWDSDGGEKYLLCNGCQSSGWCCEECGCRVSEDNAWYFVNRDEPYCRYCFEEHCANEDILDENEYYDDDLIAFAARYQINNNWYLHDTYNASFISRKEYSIYFSERVWTKLFVIDQLREDKYNYYSYYITPEDCTLLGLERFYDCYDFEDYKEMKNGDVDFSIMPQEWLTAWNINPEDYNNEQA